eukprot:TRINITY_DN13058_c0_g1_i1.p1 TRINITY_DN13058_c0_g1~~TRINITY_DN13058_c0_g1_i1.p1  ORF type:complete len:208 (+),score=35.96 TRINITY_DN13058_c0_g1_i1:45-626(+)
MNKKKVVVVVGPSGVGKGTLIGMLINEQPNTYSLSTSHTTRNPRPGEVNGVQYWFVSRSQFEEGLAQGKFIEHNLYNGNLYGTSFDAVEHLIKEGKVCVLDIDVHGAKAVKNSNLNAKFIFILPPGDDPSFTLKQRLKGRGTDTEQQIEERIKIAMTELEFFKQNEHFFDAVIINDQLTESYKAFKESIETLI